MTDLPKIEKAHVGAPRYTDGAIEFRVRGTRTHAEGTYVDQEAPEVVVLDLLPTCSYCGSLTIDDTLSALETPGTHYSGSDWKYGFPHKFYIDIPCEPFRTSSMSKSEQKDGKRVHTIEWRQATQRHHKFYTDHMRDATDEQIARWERVAAPLLGVHFERYPDGGVGWRARGGIQKWGVVAAPAEASA